MNSEDVTRETLALNTVQKIMSIVEIRAIDLCSRHVNDPNVRTLLRIRRWRLTIVRLEALGRMRGRDHYVGSDGYLYRHHFSFGYSSGIGGAHTPGESKYVRVNANDLATYKLDELVSLLDSLT